MLILLLFYQHWTKISDEHSNLQMRRVDGNRQIRIQLVQELLLQLLSKALEHILSEARRLVREQPQVVLHNMQRVNR